MVIRKVIDDIAQFCQWFARRSRQLDMWTHGWLGIVIKAVTQAMGSGSVITSAAIAFFAILSLFPLTLLTIAIASFSLGSMMDQQLIVQRLEFIAPALGQLLGENLDEIIRARGPVTIVALISLVWSSSTFLYMVTGTLKEIWGIKRSRPFWKQRGLAILFVLVFVVPIVFLASFADNMIANLTSRFPFQVDQVKGGSSLIMAIILDISLFMVLYMTLPHAESGWREILPGAIGAGLIWEAAKKVFLLFISAYLSVSNLVYGSVTAIIAILTWAYLSGMIFLFGAYLSVSLYRKKMKLPG